MSRVVAAAIVFTLLVSACVAEDGVAGNGDLISEQDALRLASAEAERRGWELSELRPEAVREGDVWVVEFYSEGRGGGGRVELRAENGEVSEVNPWR